MKLAVPDLISNSYFPAVAAVELGFFKAAGLDAEIELIFPVDKAYRALREGAVDFAGGAAHAVPAAFADWRGARLIAALAQGMYWFLVMRADLNAGRGDVGIVKGCRIGAAPMVEQGLRGLLKAAGIDLARDGVTIAPVPGAHGAGVNFGVNAARALEDKTIDGFWANGMGAAVAVSRGIGTIVLDVRRGDGPPAAFDFTFPALVATADMVARAPEKAAAAVRAIVATQQALKADVSLATRVGHKLFPASEAALIADVVGRDLPFYDPAISQESFDRMNRFLREMELIGAPASYDEVVPAQFRDLWRT